MKKAVLYARVSTEAQQKEGTIESQVLELKKQILDAGDVLVKEYIDNGHSGASMERPALDQMRKDLRINLFDSIYFLNTDRIARDVTYQNLIVAEILQHQKQIIINGKDYIHNPENKFKITVLGAVAELERAKIIERSQRGKLHKLRSGIPLNNGSNTFGYDYIPRTDTEPGKYVINKKEAKIVQLIFKLYATKQQSWSGIIRHLEKIGATTKTGKKHWDTTKLRAILMNHTYTGLKYFNTRTLVKAQNNPLRKIKYGKKVYKDKSEWIGVKVPMIVSKAIYNKAQKRLEESKQKYRSPKTTQLLSNLVRCGECGRFFVAYQRYYRGYYKGKPTGKIIHKSAYRCSRRTLQRMHAKDTDIRRCTNPEVASHILEERVFDLIEYIMTNPTKLRKCLQISTSRTGAQQHLEQKLKVTERNISRLTKQRQLLIEQYAKGKLTHADYINKCTQFDTDLHSMKETQADLLGKISIMYNDEDIEVSVKQYCHVVSAGLKRCSTSKGKRDMLLEFVEAVVYERRAIELHGSVPVQAFNSSIQDAENKVHFVIRSK